MENASELSVGIIAGTAILVAMAAMIIILVFTYQNKRKEILRKSQEQMLFAALDAERKERERISRDLHDGVSGYLNSSLNYLALGQRKLTTENQEPFENIRFAIEESIVAVKEVSQNLAPANLIENGFAAAVQENAKKLLNTAGITFNFRDGDGFKKLNETQAYELYRIIQEIITNLIKYSGAKKVSLEIESTGGIETINVIDDGIAFDFEAASKKEGNHNGIKNILARLQRINGRYDLFREKEKNIFIIWIKKQEK